MAGFFNLIQQRLKGIHFDSGKSNVDKIAEEIANDKSIMGDADFSSENAALFSGDNGVSAFGRANTSADYNPADYSSGISKKSELEQTLNSAKDKTSSAKENKDRAKAAYDKVAQNASSEDKAKMEKKTALETNKAKCDAEVKTTEDNIQKYTGQITKLKGNLSSITSKIGALQAKIQQVPSDATDAQKSEIEQNNQQINEQISQANQQKEQIQQELNRVTQSRENELSKLNDVKNKASEAKAALDELNNSDAGKIDNNELSDAQQALSQAEQELATAQTEEANAQAQYDAAPDETQTQESKNEEIKTATEETQPVTEQQKNQDNSNRADIKKEIEEKIQDAMKSEDLEGGAHTLTGTAKMFSNAFSTDKDAKVSEAAKKVKEGLTDIDKGAGNAVTLGFFSDDDGSADKSLLKEKIDDTVEDAKKDFSRAYDDFEKGNLLSGARDSVAGTIDFANKPFEYVEDLGESIIDNTETGIELIDNVGSNGAGKALKGGASNLTGSADLVGGMFSTEDGSTKEALSKIGEGVKNVAGGAFNATFGTVGSLFGGMFNSSSSAASGKEEKTATPEENPQPDNKDTIKLEDVKRNDYTPETPVTEHPNNTTPIAEADGQKSGITDDTKKAATKKEEERKTDEVAKKVDDEITDIPPTKDAPASQTKPLTIDTQAEIEALKTSSAEKSVPTVNTDIKPDESVKSKTPEEEAAEVSEYSPESLTPEKAQELLNKAQVNIPDGTQLTVTYDETTKSAMIQGLPDSATACVTLDANGNQILSVMELKKVNGETGTVITSYDNEGVKKDVSLMNIDGSTKILTDADKVESLTSVAPATSDPGLAAALDLSDLQLPEGMTPPAVLPAGTSEQAGLTQIPMEDVSAAQKFMTDNISNVSDYTKVKGYEQLNENQKKYIQTLTKQMSASQTQTQTQTQMPESSFQTDDTQVLSMPTQTLTLAETQIKNSSSTNGLTFSQTPVVVEKPKPTLEQYKADAKNADGTLTDAEKTQRHAELESLRKNASITASKLQANVLQDDSFFGLSESEMASKTAQSAEISSQFETFVKARKALADNADNLSAEEYAAKFEELTGMKVYEYRADERLQDKDVDLTVAANNKAATQLKSGQAKDEQSSAIKKLDNYLDIDKNMPDYGCIKGTIDSTVIDWVGTSTSDIKERKSELAEQLEGLKDLKDDPEAFTTRYKEITGVTFDPEKIQKAQTVQQEYAKAKIDYTGKQQVATALSDASEFLDKSENDITQAKNYASMAGKTPEEMEESYWDIHYDELKSTTLKTSSTISGMSEQDTQAELEKAFEQKNGKKFSDATRMEQVEFYKAGLSKLASNESVQKAKDLAEESAEVLKHKENLYKIATEEAFGKNELAEMLQKNQKQVEYTYQGAKIAVIVGSTIATGGAASVLHAGTLTALGATSVVSGGASLGFDTLECATDSNGLTSEEMDANVQSAGTTALFTAFGGGTNAIGSMARAGIAKAGMGKVAQSAVGNGTELLADAGINVAFNGTDFSQETLQNVLPQGGSMLAGTLGSRFFKYKTATKAVAGSVDDGIDVAKATINSADDAAKSASVGPTVDNAAKLQPQGTTIIDANGNKITVYSADETPVTTAKVSAEKALKKQAAKDSKFARELKEQELQNQQQKRDGYKADAIDRGIEKYYADEQFAKDSADIVERAKANADAKAKAEAELKAKQVESERIAKENEIKAQEEVKETPKQDESAVEDKKSTGKKVAEVADNIAKNEAENLIAEAGVEINGDASFEFDSDDNIVIKNVVGEGTTGKITKNADGTKTLTITDAEGKVIKDVSYNKDNSVKADNLKQAADAEAKIKKENEVKTSEQKKTIQAEQIRESVEPQEIAENKPKAFPYK